MPGSPSKMMSYAQLQAHFARLEERIGEVEMKVISQKSSHLLLAEQVEKKFATVRSQTGTAFNANLEKAERYVSVLATAAQEADTKIKEQKQRSDDIISGMNMKLAELEQQRVDMVAGISAELARIEADRQTVADWSAVVEEKTKSAFDKLEARCATEFQKHEQHNQAVKNWIMQAEQRIRETGIAGGGRHRPNVALDADAEGREGREAPGEAVGRGFQTMAEMR